MHTDTSRLRRFEWKYRIPTELAAELIAAFRSRTEPDAYCAPALDGAYPVRSLYYDTPDLRFYHEKKDGLRVRRKLRVRNYGDDDVYFLEIKRKINKKVVKERVEVRRSQFAGALDGMDPAVVMAGRPDGDLRTLERFRFNMRSLGLVPSVLVGYRRRALVGRGEPLRVTFDLDLRALARPREEALFEELELRPFEERCILELKFAGRPPRWLMDAVTEHRLEREPYSKYCESIDRCTDGLESSAADRHTEVSRS